MNLWEVISYLQVAIIVVLVIAMISELIWLQIKKSNEIDNANDDSSISTIKVNYKKKLINKITTYGIIIGLVLMLFIVTIPWALKLLSV